MEVDEEIMNLIEGTYREDETIKFRPLEQNTNSWKDQLSTKFGIFFLSLYSLIFRVPIRIILLIRSHSNRILHYRRFGCIGIMFRHTTCFRLTTSPIRLISPFSATTKRGIYDGVNWIRGVIIQIPCMGFPAFEIK